MGLGMEIWRVPARWQHPRDQAGEFIPLFDQDYDRAVRVWKKLSSTPGVANCFFHIPTRNRVVACLPPLGEYYLPFTTQALVCCQLYDDTGMGVPQSPVFENLADLKQWLAWQGRSREFQNAFAQLGYSSRPLKSDGSGYFRIVEAHTHEDFQHIRFIINDHLGRAVLSNLPTPAGIGGGRVIHLQLECALGLPCLEKLVFGYPAAGGKQGWIPPYLGQLVVLLDNFE